MIVLSNSIASCGQRLSPRKDFRLKSWREPQRGKLDLPCWDLKNDLTCFQESHEEEEIHTRVVIPAIKMVRNTSYFTTYLWLSILSGAETALMTLSAARCRVSSCLGSLSFSIPTCQLQQKWLAGLPLGHISLSSDGTLIWVNCDPAVLFLFLSLSFLGIMEASWRTATRCQIRRLRKPEDIMKSLRGADTFTVSIIYKYVIDLRKNAAVSSRRTRLSNNSQRKLGSVLAEYVREPRKLVCYARVICDI